MKEVLLTCQNPPNTLRFRLGDRGTDGGIPGCVIHVGGAWRLASHNDYTGAKDAESGNICC
jgi:hypothetical protein